MTIALAFLLWTAIAFLVALIVGGSIRLADRGGPPGRHRPGNVATDRASDRAA